MNVRNDPCNVYYGTLRPILTLDNKMYKRKGYVEEKKLRKHRQKKYIFFYIYFMILTNYLLCCIYLNILIFV